MTESVTYVIEAFMQSNLREKIKTHPEYKDILSLDESDMKLLSIYIQSEHPGNIYLHSDKRKQDALIIMSDNWEIKKIQWGDEYVPENIVQELKEIEDRFKSSANPKENTLIGREIDISEQLPVEFKRYQPGYLVDDNTNKHSFTLKVQDATTVQLFHEKIEAMLGKLRGDIGYNIEPGGMVVFTCVDHSSPPIINKKVKAFVANLIGKVEAEAEEKPALQSALFGGELFGDIPVQPDSEKTRAVVDPSPVGSGFRLVGQALGAKASVAAAGEDLDVGAAASLGL